jgi:hypothetical protein
MEIFYQPEDLTVFGVQVKTFPNGITEAFEMLVKRFGKERSYFGISWMDENQRVIYYAMVSELVKGEGNKYHYEKLVIHKGEYHTETINDWMSKLDSIKDVFHGLMSDSMPDKNHPCVEWYKSDDEMLCMIRYGE